MRSSDSKVYVVSILSDDGETEQCTTPCTLHAAVGSGTLRVRGPKHYEQSIFVPHADTQVTLRSACAGCYVGGAIGLAIGVPLDIASIVYAADTPNCDPYFGTDYDLCKNDRDRFTLFAIVFGTAGIILTVVGIAELIAGGARGKSRAVMSDQASAAGPKFLGAGMVPLREGGAAGAVRFSF